MTGPERSAEKPQRAAKLPSTARMRPVVVVADLVVVEEVVALAGRDHVVVAVGADLDGAVPLLGGDRGDGGEEVGLGLLAAEAAAHAADDDRHRVRRDAEDVGDHVLHLGRVLGRGIDGDVIVLAGDGEGDHALEIEVVLAADALHALQAVRRGRHRGGDVAALELQGLGDEGVVGGDRLGDVGDVGQGLGTRRGRAWRRGGRRRGSRRHGEDRLAVELDDLLGEDRVVVLADRADVVVVDVGRGQHVDDAGRGADRVEVDRDDLGVGGVGEAEVGVQRADRLGDVVGVFGEAGDVLVRRVVALLDVDAAADGRGELEDLVHQTATSRLSWAVSPVDSR